jgi:hypothetical protein
MRAIMGYTTVMLANVILNVTKAWMLEVYSAETMERVNVYFPSESYFVISDHALTGDQESLVRWWATGPKEWGR